MSAKKKTVFVAMSGGVDSSVTAGLLQKQGYEVVGVFMKNWSENDPLTGICTADADFSDVRAVCQHLRIPYYTFNFEEEYKNRVLSYFFREYQAGRTPNPDVMCNKEVKFDLFLEKAIALGADYIATGHHIRKGTAVNRGTRTKPVYTLLKGVDPIKDQTYFVYNLTQDQISKCLFPIGEYTKADIRKIAHRMNLPTADKKDSQGICFIGPVEVRDFLKRVIKTKTGNIVNLDGKVLGKHEGAWFYTIGQRRIEGLSGQPEPLYVVATDINKNTVTVGPDSATYGKGVILENLHLIDPDLPALATHQTSGLKLSAKPRYTPETFSGTLEKLGKQWQFIFDQPERALTPGQSLVLYDHDECLGGGIISQVIN